MFPIKCLEPNKLDKNNRTIANLLMRKSIVVYRTTLNKSELEWKNTVHNPSDTDDLSEVVYDEAINSNYPLKIISCYNQKCSAPNFCSEDVILQKCHTCSSINCMDCSDIHKNSGCNRFPSINNNHRLLQATSQAAFAKSQQADKEIKDFNYITALMHYSEAITLNPQCAKYFAARSSCLMTLANYDAAIADALKAISLDKKCTVAYYRAMDCYLTTGELNKLEDLITHFRLIKPGIDSINKNQIPKLNNLKKLREDITDLMACQNYEKCLQYVNDALVISSACDELQFTKMRLYTILELNSTPDMLESKTNLYIKQYSTTSFLDILKLYYKDDLKSCVTLSAEMLKLLPKTFYSIEKIYKTSHRFVNDVELANQLYETKNYTESYEILLDLLTLDSSNKAVIKRLLLKLAKIQIEIRSISESIAHLSSALIIDPSYSDALYLRAKCYFELSSPALAIKDCKVLLNLVEVNDNFKKSIEDLLTQYNVNEETFDSTDSNDSEIRYDAHRQSTKYSFTKSEITDNRYLFEKFNDAHNTKSEKPNVAKPDTRYSFSTEEIKHSKEYIDKPKKSQQKPTWQSIQGDDKNKEGCIAFTNGNYFRAHKMFSEALSICPNNAKYLTNRSACSLKLNNFKGALADGVKAVDADNTYWKGYLRTINIFLTLGEIGQADRYIILLENNVTGLDSIKFNEIPKLEKLKECDAKINKFYREHNHQECLKNLNYAMTIATHCENFENLKAECLVLTEQYDEADVIVAAGLRKDPNRSYLLFVQGLKAYYEGKFRLCISTFEQVLRNDRDFIKALEFRDKAKQMILYNIDGAQAFKAKQYERAKELFSKALLIDPTNKINSSVFYNRGSASFLLHCFKDACDDFTESLKIDETFVKALIKRAQSHYELKEFEDCLIDCEELLALPSSDYAIRIERLVDEAKQKLRGMKARNNFEILGISQHASANDIKTAFRKLSLLYHSDKHPNLTVIDRKKMERKFDEIKKAYDSLRLTYG